MTPTDETLEILSAVSVAEQRLGALGTISALEPALYVVATPIGNLRDITLRALDTLGAVSCIACEDTRMTRDLLRHLNIAPPELISVREHNEVEASQAVIARIGAGRTVAYVSDAGTPAISDPGARLAQAVRAAKLRVIPIPGVSAVTTALSASGLLSTAFVFLGFAPTGAGELRDFVDAMAARAETSVFFESPHRIEKTLQLLAQGLPETRAIIIARELTKKFETISQINAGDLTEWLEANKNKARGEFVVCVDGAEKVANNAQTSVDSRTLLKALLEELPAAKAAKIAAKLTGEPRDALYTLAESLRKG